MTTPAGIAIAALLVAAVPLPCRAGDAAAAGLAANPECREAAGAPCTHLPGASKDVDLGIPDSYPPAPPAPPRIAPGAARRPPVRWTSRGVTIGAIAGLAVGAGAGYLADGEGERTAAESSLLGGAVGLAAGLAIGYAFDVVDALRHRDPYLPVPPLPETNRQPGEP